MDNIEQRIKDEKFFNWIKCTLSLEQTKKALQKYVEEKFELYTDGKSRLCHGKLLSADEVAHMRDWFGKEWYLEAIEYNYSRREYTWNKKYNCACESTFVKVLSLYVKEPTSKGKDLCWENSVKETETSLEWKIAKVFMPMGNKANKGPEDTDPYAMFHLMKNCDLFHNSIRANHLKKAKEIRNKLFHSSENRVTDKETKEYFDTMIAVLTDASNDQEVQQQTRVQIKDDIKKMEKLKYSDITLTLFDDLDKALRLKRAGIYYDFEKRLCKDDPVKLRQVLTLVERIGGETQLLEKYLHQKETIDKEIDELRKQRDNVKALVVEIPPVISDFNKRNSQIKTDVNVMKTEFRRRANEIQININDLSRILRTEISQLESEGMIIVVIVTVVIAVLFRIILFLDQVCF